MADLDDLIERAQEWMELADASPHVQVFSEAWAHYGIVRDLALLASSAPATASEDATLSDSVTDSVTSSDGDRGLSEEEWRAIRSAPRVRDAIDQVLASRTAQPEGVERVEWGVRYGDGEIDSTVTYSGDTGKWAYGDRPSAEKTIANARRSIEEDPSCADDYEPMSLVRRTVTTYATVTGPWEVVGDE